MEIRWFGQSAFLLRGERSVVVDPFGDVSVLATRGLRFDYPPIEGVRSADDARADLLAASRRSKASRS